MAYAGKSGESRFQPPERDRTDTARPVGVAAVGLAIGLLVGAGTALLFAPREGAELRRAARHRMRRLGWRAEDAWLDLRAELRRAGRQARRARRRMVEEADVVVVDD